METKVKKRSEILKTASAKLKEWKFPLLILLIGAVLVLWPFNKQTSNTETNTTVMPSEAANEITYAEQTAQKLSDILSKIDGAGKVSVMLTVQGSDITYFQTDNDSSVEEQDGSTRSSTQYKTVILSGSGEYDKAAVIKTEYPSFLGALILSQGADNPTVRLALVNAVSSLLGLGTDKISVEKMK